MPDSAAYFTGQLTENFPQSPQTLYLLSAGSADILGHLLDEKRERQEVALANLTDEERAALVEELDEAAIESVDRPIASAKLRRRMVYLKMRDNIIYEPTDAMLSRKIIEQNIAYEEAAAAVILGEAQSAYADSVMATMPDSLAALNAVMLDSLATVPGDSVIVKEDPKVEEKEKEKDDGGFDLR